MNRILSTSTHGIIDYVTGIALFFAPTLFGFSEVGGPAVLLPRLLGLGIIVYSLLTRYEFSVAKVIPMNIHLMLDLAGGLLLAISPFVFGFINQPVNAWLPHIVVGLMEVGVSLATKTEPDRLHASH